MTWSLLQYGILVSVMGYLFWQDGKLRQLRILAEHWQQSCTDRQRTIDRILATPAFVRPELRQTLEDRQRPN